MKTPEGYEKEDICKFLQFGGKIVPAYMWFFKPYSAGFGKSGVSDIVGCYRGKFFAIEVKREGKAPTPIQTRRMAEIEAAGGKTFWGTAAKVIPEFEAWIAAKTETQQVWEDSVHRVDDQNRREAAGEDVSDEIRQRLPGGSDW